MSIKKLTYEEELDIGQRIERYRAKPNSKAAKKAAHEAVHELLEAYTPALWSMVNSCVGQNESSVATSRDDLFAEAYIEAYKLAFKFNPNGFSKGNPGRRFNKYVQKSVIRKVRSEIMKASTPLSASVASIKNDFYQYAKDRDLNPETAHAGVRGGFIPGHDDTVDLNEMSERLLAVDDEVLAGAVEYPEMITALKEVFSEDVFNMLITVIGDSNNHGTINDAKELSDKLGISAVTAYQFIAVLPEIFNHPAIRSKLKRILDKGA